MKTVNAEKFITYECGACNHIMIFSEPTHLLRIQCPMCSNQFKLETISEVTIIDGEKQNG